MPRTVAACLTLAVFAFAAGLARPQAEGGRYATGPLWLGKHYGYVANNESLRSLLYDFGASLDIPVIVSSKISTIADDLVPTMTAEEFLAELHARFRLAWVYDGTTLYLYDGAESVRETVGFPFALRDAFTASIEGDGIRGIPLNWVFLPAENQLQLSGPPRFVEWGSEVARKIAENSPHRGKGLTPEEDLDHVVRIFNVEYGYVGQTANNATGAKVPIVGLAEMIAKLMNVAHVSEVIGIHSSPGASGAAAKLKGTGVVFADAAGASSQAARASRVARARDEGQEAFVIGDPRLNAVIVRDRSYRMPIYERLIRELDSPVDQIEIGVSVLDIDASAAEELRVDLTTDALQVNARATNGGNNIFSAQNPWDFEGLAVRLRALRNSSKSRILTRPSVTTLDNHEASFQNNRTFYVRLGGNDAESVDLAPVSYGWVVRIRPHIIYAGDYKRVLLAIHIEDGSRGGVDQAVTGVPETSQNLIQTRAVVREGNSLLIGGYTVREQTRFKQRIPLLGRIPIMGRLFSTKADRDQTLARYFLITPRILPAAISYEINSGFEDSRLEAIDAIKAIEDVPGPRQADRGTGFQG